MARRSRRGHLAALGALALLAVTACGADDGVTTEHADAGPGGVEVITDPATTDPSDTTGSTDPAVETSSSDPGLALPPGVGALDWLAYGEDTDTSILTVPVDYDDPEGASFDLLVARHRAHDPEERIGSLLVNPGGPGFGGTDFALAAEHVFQDPILEHFDIVAWDPRGTGLSLPAIDCIDDYDAFFGALDITPDDEAERQAIVDNSTDLTEACVTKNADILDHVGTNDSARDIDSLRRALGEETISYFGFSYGSELGATWATLFPETVRAAVLDGAVDPEAGTLQQEVQQQEGFEGTLDAFLTQCGADPGCAFNNGGKAAAAYDVLMDGLDEQPIPSSQGRPDVNRAVARQASIQAMYNDDLYWGPFADALAAAQDGDGAGLLAMYDDYFQRAPDGTWGNELEAFLTISCMDRSDRPTVADYDATMPEISAVAPRLTPPGTNSDYQCAFFPPSKNPRATITGAGVGPIVVVGTTGDPATPLASTRRMAAALEDGRLIVVTAETHTGYGESACGDDLIHGYLVDLEAPPAETDC
ncbi:MAG: alpha/beta hydrolase [Ilumatobacteraceae bacterium]